MVFYDERAAAGIGLAAAWRPMAVVIAYVRARRGRDGGADTAAQRSAIERWARRGRHRVVAVIEEDPQAQLLADRRGLAEVLADVRDGLVDGLVVHSLRCLDDTLVVQEQLLAELRASGVRVYSLQPAEASELRRVAADPARQAVREVLEAAASNAPHVAALRRHGRRSSHVGAGSPPYGYRKDGGRLVPDAAEQATLARIAELRAQGATFREIARALDLGGHPPKRGERWHPESVRRIVERFEQ